MFLILFFMLYEYFDVVFAGKEGAFGRLFSGILLAIIGSSVFVYKYDFSEYVPWLFGVALLNTLINAYLIFVKKTSGLQTRPYYLQGLVYITIPITLCLYYLHDHDDFRFTILAIFLIIWTNDAFAYLVGSQFGKNKIAPGISPGKTWEGFFGGLLFVSIVTYLLTLIPVFQGFSWTQWAIIAAIVSVLGTIGDFLESAFKRQFKIKDSGNILPGHGGFLDRFDSFIFAVPIILLVIKFCFE